MIFPSSGRLKNNFFFLKKRKIWRENETIWKFSLNLRAPEKFEVTINFSRTFTIPTCCCAGIPQHRRKEELPGKEKLALRWAKVFFTRNQSFVIMKERKEYRKI